ncbi:MAG: DUF4387 family protein [Rhodobacteraceae bacterium]|nr:DUF4387 family protein [Paracoccaceae bacterium]
MTRLADMAPKIRSKNAGPFWLTIDIFCETAEVFTRISDGLQTAEMARAFATQTGQIKRFDIAALNVIKISLPRPAVQGTREDRDMHGASFAEIVGELRI